MTNTHEIDRSFKYCAFISYSHADEKWAAWLHRSLETFTIPKNLVGKKIASREIPRRLFPVFRDREEFEASPDLSERLQRALGDSDSLIVICSPNSSRSIWVNKEIETFIALGRSHRIFCMIVDGDPAAAEDAGLCFPKALFSIAPGDNLSDKQRREPLAVDVRLNKDHKRDAVVKLIAGLIGVGYDDLKRRDDRRRLRRKQTAAAAATALLFIAGTTYVLIADSGARLIGSDQVRDILDGNEISLLRPIETRDTIKNAADEMKSFLCRKLEAEIEADGFRCEYVAHPAGGRGGIDVWVSAQVASALLRNDNMTSEQFISYMKILERAFENDLPVESQGKPIGWMAAHTSYLQAEPTLWLGNALALALQHPDRLTPEEEALIRQRIDYVQVCLNHYIGSDGEWFMVSGMQKPAKASTYTTTLALMMLLEMRKSAVPWNGDHHRRDKLIESAAKWLISEFDDRIEPSGWHGTVNNATEFSNLGLTLQILSTLMRAHEEAAVEIPGTIVNSIPENLIPLIGKPYGTGEAIRPVYAYRDYQDHPRSDQITIVCLWYPWSIACAIQWLNSPVSANATQVTRARMKRALGYFVVNLSESAHETFVRKKRTYIAGETLYGLSFVNQSTLDLK